MSHTYKCIKRSATYGEKPCLKTFSGQDLDHLVTTRVLAVLSGPTVEMLREALEFSRRGEMARKNNLKMEGERLERRERLLREQLEACTPSLSWAWNDI